MQKEFVILVDEQNNELGLMEKLEAHRNAALHRAFSVFVFNSSGDLLIQQRALNKYHSAGLWTNTCCSHPRAGETTSEGAHRRLKEEMGIDCALTEKFSFVYKAPFENGLTEHELDFIYTGIFNGEPSINTEEVNAFKWIGLQDLYGHMQTDPHQYTAWFHIIMEKYKSGISLV